MTMPRNRSRAGVLTLLGALTLVVLAPMMPPVLFGHSAAAEPSRRAQRRAAVPVPPSRAAPDVTGTVKSTMPPAAPALVAPAAKTDADEGPLKPFDLPAAPRARMRQCGESWQKIKMSGNAGDRTWREFATTCLTEHVTPPAASPHDVSSNTAR